MAIFHDYFSTIGGGEKVVLSIAECLHGDIYSTDISMPHLEGYRDNIYSCGSVPQSPFLRQMGSVFRFINLDVSDQYDMFVFSGNWAHHGSFHHGSFHHAPSVMYCHTPVRALYDLYPVFKSRLPRMIQPGYAAWAWVMRTADQRSMRKITRMVANSRNVQRRINNYYNRDASVIYPPVDSNAYFHKENEEYWLSVNRLYPEKRIELQIEAFSKMPDEKLIIVGGFSSGDHAAGYARRIHNLIKGRSNITLLGQITDSKLKDLYSRCTGLICTAMEEDFGITPLEAMASGKPVIAVAEGGFLETVTPECGRFIQPEVADIIKAVRCVSGNPDRYQEACLARAQEFDIRNFNDTIRTVVRETYEGWSDSV